MVNGAALYKSKTCLGCHGEKGDSQALPINMAPFIAGTKDLYKVINDTMPKTNPSDCVGQCAADIAAYMKTWSTTTVPPVQACGDHLTYGARQLKLLTRSEYQNSVEDLVGIDFNAATALPSDSKIHGYANNIGTSVSQLHETAYFESASKIAAWAKEHNFAGIVTCSLTDKTACINDFTSNFAKKAFRRPLTKGEISAFQSLFGDNFTNGDVSVGLEMAVTSALMSPAFLYRSEQGVPVSSGPYDGSGYEFTGTTTTLLATEFTDKRWFVAGSTTGALVIGDTSNGRQEAKLGKHITYSGTGSLFQVRIRGVIPKDGSIPVLRYGVGSFSGSLTVDWEDFRTISLYFPGLSGTSEFALFLAAGTAQVEVWDLKVGAAKAKLNAPDSDAYALTPYEMATYLSYTFTGSTPDATLLAAAEAGQLETDAQVSTQVDRLLNNPRAKKQLGDFAAQWIGTDLAQTQPKNMTLYPALTDEVRSVMAQEVRELFTYAALTSNDLKQFFASDYAHVNKTLANYYGLSGANSSSFTRVPGGNQRGGILTTGAFYTAYGNFEETSPIVRAARVREKFLCQDIPPPPAGIAIDRSAAEKKIADIIGAGAHVTQRYRTQLLTEAPYCAQCHAKIINPLGFGMEDYDTIGRYQQQDIWGSMIDPGGILHGIEALSDLNNTQANFTGGKGLGLLLTNTQVAYSCFVNNAFRFATGEGVEIIDKNNAALGTLTAAEKADNQCSVKGITDNMIAANHNPRVAFKSLATMKQIRYRKEMGR